MSRMNPYISLKAIYLQYDFRRILSLHL